MSTSANPPSAPTSGRRVPWRPLGIVALATAVIVPGVALAQNSLAPTLASRASSAGEESDVSAAVTSVDSAAGVRVVATTADNEATRAALYTFFDELQQLVDSQQFAPPGAPQLPMSATDMSEAVASARSVIETLDASDLAAWQAIIDANPGWSDQPEILADAVASNPFDLGGVAEPAGYRAPSILTAVADSATGATRSTALHAVAAMAPAPQLLAAGDPDGIYSDCEIAQPNVRGLFYSAWIATQIAGAAGAVASGVPDGDIWFPLLIIAGVAFGVANGIAIGLNHALTLALDCVSAKDDAEFRKTLPTLTSAMTPTNPTGIIPGSTQASVDQLANSVAGVITTVTAVNARIQQILVDQLVVIESLGLASSSATQIQTTAADLQDRAKDVRANIGTATDQAVEANRPIDCAAVPPAGSDPCNTANGLANTTDTRLDTILADTDDLQSLALRMAIERALSEPSSQPHALFSLPAAGGGHLELVGDIVAQTIANVQAAGQSTGNASSFVATATAAIAAGDFVGAFVAYSQAYQAAVR